MKLVKHVAFLVGTLCTAAVALFGGLVLFDQLGPVIRGRLAKRGFNLTEDDFEDGDLADEDFDSASPSGQVSSVAPGRSYIDLSPQQHSTATVPPTADDSVAAPPTASNPAITEEFLTTD